MIAARALLRQLVKNNKAKYITQETLELIDGDIDYAIQLVSDGYDGKVMTYIVNNFEITPELFDKLRQTRLPSHYYFVYWPLTVDQFRLLASEHMAIYGNFDNEFVRNCAIAENTNIGDELVDYLCKNGYSINYKYYKPKYTDGVFYHKDAGRISSTEAKLIYDESKSGPSITLIKIVLSRVSYNGSMVYEMMQDINDKIWQTLNIGLDQMRKEREVAMTFAMISLAFCEDAGYLQLTAH